MLLKIAGRLPFVQCLTYFPFETHKAGAIKFLFLWTLTSLPVLFAAFLSPIPDGDAGIVDKFIVKLNDAISVSEQFVYTASFITPMLYILFEKYQNSSSENVGSKISQSLKTVFKGYWLMLLVALLLMLFTAAGFSSLKVNPGAFKQTFLYAFLVKCSPVIYLFALFCWYLSLLDGVYTGDFVVESRRSENAVKTGLAARLKSRGDE